MTLQGFTMPSYETAKTKRYVQVATDISRPTKWLRLRNMLVYPIVSSKYLNPFLQVTSILKKDKPTKLAELQEELANWEAEVANVQQGMPMQVALEKLKQVEIPGIIQEQATLETSLHEASAEANSQSEELESAKLALKTLQTLKQQAGTISIAVQKRDTALQYAQGLEEALGAGGSLKSLEEIQAELSTIQTKQYVLKFLSQSNVLIVRQARCGTREAVYP